MPNLINLASVLLQALFLYKNLSVRARNKTMPAAIRGLARQKGKRERTIMLKWLKDILGEAYTEDIDKKVADEIGKEFVSRADFNSTNEAKKTLEATKKALEDSVKERDTQLEELKKVDAAGLQAKITELQTANTTAQTEFEAQLKQIKLDTALETRLIKEGAVNTKAVKSLLDSAKISLDGENLVGLDEQLKTLKESEKWAFAPVTPGKTGLHQGGAPAEGATVADEIKSALYGGT